MLKPVIFSLAYPIPLKRTIRLVVTRSNSTRTISYIIIICMKHRVLIYLNNTMNFVYAPLKVKNICRNANKTKYVLCLIFRNLVFTHPVRIQRSLYSCKHNQSPQHCLQPENILRQFRHTSEQKSYNNSRINKRLM